MNSTPNTDESDYNYDDYIPNYNDYESIEWTPSIPSCSDAVCVFLATVKVIIFVLGVTGNGLVIWIAGFRMKKSVNSRWYLSLAVSDFLFCAFLPISTAIYHVRKDWIFGLAICKFISLIFFLNMFSSVFLLFIISVDHYLAMFPVWAQNQWTIAKASMVVIVAWIFSAALSTPSLIYSSVVQDLIDHGMCCNRYNHAETHIAIVTRRFIFGFIIPFLIILVFYILIIRKMTSNQMAKSKKSFKVMTAVITTFFICWLPFHIVALMVLNYAKYRDFLPFGQVLAVTLASANSFLNPFLYAFMGKENQRKCWAILSKIQNAIEEEGRSTARTTSITFSTEHRLSTAV